MPSVSHSLFAPGVLRISSPAPPPTSLSLGFETADQIVKSLSYRDFEYLLAVKHYANITRAAYACNITQPALSNQIRRIERRLGVDIFVRRSDGIYPSQPGDALLDQAVNIVEQLKRFEDLVLAYKDPFAGPVRLGICTSLASFIIPFILKNIDRSTSLGNIELQEATASDGIDLLARREIEFFVGSMACERDDITATFITDDHYVVVASKNFSSLASRGPVYQELPLPQTFMNPGLRDQVTNLLGDHTRHLIGTNIPDTLKDLSLQTTIEYVALGETCVILPNSIASHMIYHRDDLIAVPVHGLFPKFTINLLHRPTASSNDLISDVATLLADCFDRVDTHDTAACLNKKTANAES